MANVEFTTGAATIPGPRAAPAAPANKGEGDFLDALHSAMDQVQTLQGQAQQQATGVLTDDGPEVHQAMIAVEKAELAFELMMQVRNKIVQAYQEVSRMTF